MAERQTEFTYHSIELHKSQSLGSGAYGGVCRAKCDGLPCAAKIMHPTLFDLHDPGAVSYLHKFQEECRLLSLPRHPNIVQYLATCSDPETRLPVLLMELCDESLTAFLEKSPGPLSYHIQINICLDIALALVYLHSNGLIHRDLTGNNVLVIAGPRAKITDFGMSKLASVNPCITTSALCPGNVLYMSPEVLDDAKTYGANLDIFSFGVIMIQIVTRQFPNPTDRFRSVSVPQFDEDLRQLVPETERREAHLKLIPDTHSLKPLVLHCLKRKEKERPSALQLSERLSELKQYTQYTESMHQVQSSSDIQQLQQQLQDQRILIEAKMREAQEHQTQITELDSMLEDKIRDLQTTTRQLMAKQQIIQGKNEKLQKKDRQLQQKQHEVETKEKDLQQTQRELQASEQFASKFLQTLESKDKVITDLHKIISAHERKIQQLEQQDTACRNQPQPRHVATPHTTVAAAQRGITWREGENAPEKMIRGAAVVYGSTVFIKSANSAKVYSYQNILGQEQWSQLPENPNEDCGLVIIDGILTSVGGYNRDCTNTLLSLTGEGKEKQWSEIFPPMPTPRWSAACVATKQALVVAGGHTGSCLTTVEVMNINSKQWTTASPLPQKQALLSGAVCGDTLYLAGGSASLNPSKSVFSCSLPDLLTSSTSLRSRIQRKLSQSGNVWKEISCLPVIRSTLVSFNGHLLAIGGSDGSWNHTSAIYRYNSLTDSWNVVSQMMIKRSACLAVALPEDHLIIAMGGLTHGVKETDSVEIVRVTF